MTTPTYAPITYAGINLVTEAGDQVIARFDNCAYDVMQMTDEQAGDWIKAVFKVTLDMAILPKGPGSL